MKKVLFMTDFFKTISPDGILTMKEYESNIDTLINLLIKIKEDFNANSIIFSISTNVRDYSHIEQFINVIKRKTFNNKDFEIGKMYLYDKVIEYIDGKEHQIESIDEYKEDKLIKYIKELKSNSIELVWVGFADDRHAEDVNMALRDLYIPYNTFKPCTNTFDTPTMFTSKDPGIIGLNEALTKFIEKKGTTN